MKTTVTLFTLIIFLFISQSLTAQNEYLDYQLRDTVSDENYTIFNMNDFRDALVQLGINVYKWNLPIPKDKDYKLNFYIQEYEKRKLVKDTVIESFSSKIWGFNGDHRAEYQYIRNLRIISEMPDWTDETDKFRFKIALNSGKREVSKSIFPRHEYGLYYLRKFEETEFEIGKNIPLLLFTAGWETNVQGDKVRRFCAPNFAPADLQDDSFDNSDHYFIIGYRVVDEEFYGRD